MSRSPLRHPPLTHRTQTASKTTTRTSENSTDSTKLARLVELSYMKAATSVDAQWPPDALL